MTKSVGALEGDVDPDVFDRLTAMSDGIVRHIPNAGNLFGRVG